MGLFVGTDAQRTAVAAWAAFDALQRVFAGTSANSDTSGGADTAPPEKLPVPENPFLSASRRESSYTQAAGQWLSQPFRRSEVRLLGLEHRTNGFKVKG
jgi:hypothetical protein